MKKMVKTNWDQRGKDPEELDEDELTEDDLDEELGED